MSRFAFYQGIHIDLVTRLREELTSLWGQVKERSLGRFWLFMPETDFEQGFCEWRGVLGAISGYVRHADLGTGAQDSNASVTQHNRLFLSEIGNKKAWPLESGWTGSFSAVTYSKNDGELTICNDLLGHIPLYFSILSHGLLGGTGLIPLARATGHEVDAVGLLQRITPPYCNYGRRTLLKNFSRLLPGEIIRFSRGSKKGQSQFDNTLFQGSIDGKADLVAKKVWNQLKSEIRWATDGMARTGVALSGGWDSRLVLGGLSYHPNIVDCFTYGNEEHYESKIAKRCATAVGARHHCFPIEANYFPPRMSLEPLVLETESGNYMEWFNMISWARKERGDKCRLLLGDLCESIDGRYIEEFASRRARRRSFARGLIGARDHIKVATPANFANWKQAKIRQIIENTCRSASRLSNRLAISDWDVVNEETSNDLELSMSRVEANMPAWAPVFDELFAWLHYVRFLMANQLIWLGAGYDSRCPAISMGFLRFITKVNPRLRMRRRLMNSIARLPEFQSLARIPSAQIPWLDARQPAALRDLVWGLRSGLDQLLIRRVLKSKKPDKRQRVLSSLDFIKEYRRASVSSTVDEWFSGDWIRPELYKESAARRANLSSWPLINVDITAAANVSMILDLCSRATRQRGVDDLDCLAVSV